MSENSNETKNQSNKIINQNQINKDYQLCCMCCNKIIKSKSIQIYYFGTLIQLCGDPCKVRDYLETQ